MYVQKVRSPAMGALRGIAVVLGIVLAVFVDLYLTRLLTLLLPEPVCGALFWVIGIAIALWALRRYILCYSYAVTDSLLRISYAYGRYERLMSDLYFNNMSCFGPVEEVKKRYPNARVDRATRPGCPLEPMAIACRDGGQTRIYIIQPDDTVRAKLDGYFDTRKKK